MTTDLPGIEVRLASADQVRPLRMRVLRAGRPETESIYPYDRLPETVHVAAFAGDAVVGCATVFPEPYETEPQAWRLRGMAVDIPLQGRGVGAAIMSRLTLELRQRGVPLLWCNARTVALSFYRRQGFTVVGDEFFTVGGVPHYVATLDVRLSVEH